LELNRVKTEINAGNKRTAINYLNAFIKDVNADISTKNCHLGLKYTDYAANSK